MTSFYPFSSQDANITSTQKFSCLFESDDYIPHPYHHVLPLTIELQCLETVNILTAGTMYFFLLIFISRAHSRHLIYVFVKQTNEWISQATFSTRATILSLNLMIFMSLPHSFFNLFIQQLWIKHLCLYLKIRIKHSTCLLKKAYLDINELINQVTNYWYFNTDFQYNL